MGIARLFTQTVTVETYQGSGPYGDVFAAPVTRRAFVNDSLKLVRDQKGEEVVSSARLYGPLEDAADYEPGSRVTFGDRTHRVIVANRQDAAGPASSHHVAVELI